MFFMHTNVYIGDQQGLKKRTVKQSLAQNWIIIIVLQQTRIHFLKVFQLSVQLNAAFSFKVYL